jgi:hypothetical protein
MGSGIQLDAALCPGGCADAGRLLVPARAASPAGSTNLKGSDQNTRFVPPAYVLRPPRVTAGLFRLRAAGAGQGRGQRHAQLHPSLGRRRDVAAGRGRAAGHLRVQARAAGGRGGGGDGLGQHAQPRAAAAGVAVGECPIVTLGKQLLNMIGNLV